MKSFILAATVVAGLLCSTSSADAQWRGRRGGAAAYTYPTYTYSYPSTYYYSYPTYSSSGVVTSSYYTPVTSGQIITSGGTYYTTPTYSYPMYSSPTYYNNGYYYDNGSYYNGRYYSNGNYNNGSYVSPASGVYWGGRRIWRW